MPTIITQQLNDKTFRLSLKQHPEPYWGLLKEGLYIGYYKGKLKNSWVGKKLKLNGTPSPYLKKYMGEADCFIERDGKYILSFDEAINKIIKWNLT